MTTNDKLLPGALEAAREIWEGRLPDSTLAGYRLSVDSMAAIISRHVGNETVIRQSHRVFSLEAERDKLAAQNAELVKALEEILDISTDKHARAIAREAHRKVCESRKAEEGA